MQALYDKSYKIFTCEIAKIIVSSHSLLATGFMNDLIIPQWNSGSRVWVSFTGTVYCHETFNTEEKEYLILTGSGVNEARNCLAQHLKSQQKSYLECFFCRVADTFVQECLFTTPIIISETYE